MSKERIVETDTQEFINDSDLFIDGERSFCKIAQKATEIVDFESVLTS